MLSTNDPGHIKRVKKVSYKLNIPEEVIELSLFYMSEYIKKKISEKEIEQDRLLTKEEFDNILPIIKIPNMGYLKPNYYKYKAIYTKKKQREERNERTKSE